MSLAGKRVALMLAEMYQEVEVWYPYYRLKEEGAEVVLVADKAGQAYPSRFGYPAVADVAAKDVQGGDFDAVIVPGGFAPDFMRREQAMVDFITQCVRADIVLAAICHGGWMLCCTDAFRGKQATSFYAIKYDVINAGAQWIDAECVVDGKLITARKPADLPAFMKAVIAALGAA
jgi:protease I